MVQEFSNRSPDYSSGVKKALANFNPAELEAKAAVRPQEAEKKLLDLAAHRLPDRNALNFGPYTIKPDDVPNGILTTLAREYPQSKLNDPVFIKLAYRNLLKNVGPQINTIQAGDELSLDKGDLSVKRVGPTLAGVGVDLYDWAAGTANKLKDSNRRTGSVKPADDGEEEEPLDLNMETNGDYASLMDCFKMIFTDYGDVKHSARALADGRILAQSVSIIEDGRYRATDTHFVTDNPIAALEFSANNYYYHAFQENLSFMDKAFDVDASSHGGEPYYLDADGRTIRANNASLSSLGYDASIGFNPPCPRMILSGGLDYGGVVNVLNQQWHARHPKQ